MTGRYDLIVQVTVPQNDDLADVVTGRIGKIPGIQRSETIIAFRNYADSLLDAGFALGSG